MIPRTWTEYRNAYGVRALWTPSRGPLSDGYWMRAALAGRITGTYNPREKRERITGLRRLVLEAFPV